MTRAMKARASKENDLGQLEKEYRNEKGRDPIELDLCFSFVAEGGYAQNEGDRALRILLKCLY